MKNLRILMSFVLTALFLLTMSSCKKCNDENPRARIINNGTEKADVQVKTSGGNTININSIEPGTSSSYSSYAPGQVTFTISVAGTDNEKIVDVATCYDYDIAIDANNNITAKPIDRN